MVRLGIFSDLHLELDRQAAPVDLFRFSAPELPMRSWIGPSMEILAGAVDLVLLAGDIDARTRGVTYAHVLSGFLGVPVVYVAGNHEYYGGELGLTAEMQAAAREADGVHFLENDRVDFQIKDKRVAVLGATLWTDFELLGGDRREEAMRAAEVLMTDYRLIRAAPPARALHPAHTAALHAHSRAWLEAQLSCIDPDTMVIVLTHHAPSARSLPAERKRDLVAASYASNLEAMIAENRPALWVHGHTHWMTSYRIHGTRVVSHPFGYPHDRVAQMPLILTL